jgi:integrase
VSRQLGHSSISITMNGYGHLFLEEHDKVADALETAFKKAVPPEPGDIAQID